ncbi:30S ribosomal protein S16 [Buchnera aphidicola]|uniref:30S ribosomal protein S16 n=1 Tax=Buchnera aphidicola TaxID=9 RepID=UPI0030EC903F
MIKIRLARHGSKKKPFYKIMVADQRYSRNGRFIEKIGFFDPFVKNKNKKFYIKIKKVEKWIKKGAQLSKRTKFILKNFKKINNLI